MGITSLKAFTGEAEVLGKIRHVSFDGAHSMLMVYDVDLGDARAIIDHLSLGAIAQVSAEEREILRAGNKKAADAGAGATAPDFVAQTYVPPPEHQKIETGLVAAIAGTMASKAVDAVSGVSELAHPLTGDIPETVRKASRMLPIVEYFYNVAGLRGVEAITRACEAAREQIPALKRVSDMSERVSATLAAYFADKEPARG